MLRLTRTVADQQRTPYTNEVDLSAMLLKAVLVKTYAQHHTLEHEGVQRVRR